MLHRLIDSGFDGLKASYEQCDSCETPTVHLRVEDGVPVCHACGYNPLLESLTDYDDVVDYED